MTAHRHKGLTGKWLTLLGGDGAHTHPAAGHTHDYAASGHVHPVHPDLAALGSRLDAIEAWIATHEDWSEPEPEPPPTPPLPVGGSSTVHILPFMLGV